MCMVYFHAVDVVLDRKDCVRAGWQSKCHLPKALFASVGVKGRKRKAASKCRDFALFKRMIAVKDVVYRKHRKMMKIYERYCDEAKLPKYWDDEDDDEHELAAVPAPATNEVIDDEGF